MQSVAERVEAVRSHPRVQAVAQNPRVQKAAADPRVQQVLEKLKDPAVQAQLARKALPYITGAISLMAAKRGVRGGGKLMSRLMAGGAGVGLINRGLERYVRSLEERATKPRPGSSSNSSSRNGTSARTASSPGPYPPPVE